jgi:uncharacterized protein
MCSKFNRFLKLFLLMVTITFISMQLVNASVYDERHLELLAVQTNEDGTTVGKSADLYLEIRDGSGRVFLDTTPLTKIDTQASTRYAKDIACEYFSLNCDSYDFFYTIRSDSNIIGGPSAGAAIAALTAITVMDLDYDDSIALTGTINSGGTIGPVGGVKSKIEVANDNGIKKVLIPIGASNEIVQSYDNYSSNLNSRQYQGGVWKGYYSRYYSQSTSSPPLTLGSYSRYVLGIDAIEVVDLSEVIYEFSGFNYSEDFGELTVDDSYIQIMKGLDEKLCFRSEKLLTDLTERYFGLKRNMSDEEIFEIQTRQNVSANARVNENYYASASACFGLNVYLNYLIIDLQNYSNSEFLVKVELLAQEISGLERSVESEELLTISDLQTKMVVKERLSEAKEYLEITLEQNSSYALSYANERIESAKTWKEFFEMDGKKLDLSLESLQNVCFSKISEAQERYQYASLFFGYDISYIGDKITLAQKAWNAGNYELCIVQAAQAKAEASSIVSSLGLGTEVSLEYLNGKKEAALRTLIKNTKEGQFPILGYSYYMFAENLVEDNAYSALLYFEYALEMSELNRYFVEIEQENLYSKMVDSIGLSVRSKTFINGFLQGLSIGILVSWLFFHSIKRHKA